MKGNNRRDRSAPFHVRIHKNFQKKYGESVAKGPEMTDANVPSNEQSRTREDQDLPQATLGKRRETPFLYAPELLEPIPFRPAEVNEITWVSNNCMRFTSLCPVTGQPDWADIFINYIPAKHLVESKSLKEYFNSFRMHGDFHEDCCRIICRDLVQCMQPRYIEVCGQFDTRGSIAIWPYVQWANPEDQEAQDIRRHRQLHYRPGAYTPNGYSRQI